MLQQPRPHLEKARVTLDSAAAALRDTGMTDASICKAEAPGVCPELSRIGYAMPPPPLQPMRYEEGRRRLGEAIAQLSAMCSLAGVSGLGGLMRLVDHIASQCTNPVCRGVLYLLLSPQPAPDTDEASAWVPSQRHYLQQLCLPSDLVSSVCA
jgi:hypothetical protein